MLDSHPELDMLPVVEVPVDSLCPGYSPRIAGHDEQNVRILAELDRPWPPLLVHRPSNRVIDGMHRLLAARRRGDRTVEVRLHDCDDMEAFILAVRVNVSHGLPLSLADRKAAARRILESRPEWSDRRVAMVAGLSDKTVGGIRREGPPPEDGREARRVGRDGRSRPVDAASRRATVTRLLRENPGSPLRQIADRAGVSTETVRSVRQDLRSRETSEPRAGSPERGPGLAPSRGLQMLLGDPALRSTDAGRLLLRILSTTVLIDQNRPELIEAIPEHDLPVFQQLAAAGSEAWRSLAELAARRATSGPVVGDRADTAA